jgi:hypothetical protein
MAEANPLWGALRIHGELLKLGIDVSERTVSNLMPRRKPRPPSQTWRTFLKNHMINMVSIDFFTVPTATFRILFVLVILSHSRRKVVYFNVTSNPTPKWTAQQIVNAFPWDTAPKYLLRDRDSIGYYRGDNCTPKSLAKSFRRENDRLNTKRLHCSPHRAEGKPPESYFSFLFSILSLR